MQRDYHDKIRPDYGDFHEEETPQGGVPRWLAAFLIAILAAAAAYWWWNTMERQALTTLDEVATVTLPAEEALPPQHPLPAEPELMPGAMPSGQAQVRDLGPVPELDNSDGTVQNILQQLTGNADLTTFLVPQNLIRKFVVTIDNLPAKRIPHQYLPLQRPAGSFMVREEKDEIVIDAENYARYTPFVDLFTVLSGQDVAAVYIHFYPLFQEAYEDLGYPDQYFNDRMIAAIDDLLATPQVPGPIPLVQPSVYYHFADPELEALSAGQKLLLRMGPVNAAKVKQLLKEIRGRITAVK